MFAHPVAEIAHFDEVEIVVLRVDVFAGELLGEKGGRKTVTEGVSDESVLAHVERGGLFLSSVERGESEGEAAEFHIVESCLLEDTLHHFTPTNSISLGFLRPVTIDKGLLDVYLRRTEVLTKEPPGCIQHPFDIYIDIDSEQVA